MKRKEINFTRGGVVGNLILFAFPIIISELLQNLYNSADSLVVGNFVGENALAAVSVCAPITSLLVGFFNGLSMGNTVVVARAFGQGDDKRTNHTIRFAFTFSLILGVLVSVLGILLSSFLLRTSGVNWEIYCEAILYLRIYLIGVMFMVIYNCGTGILRAVGDSRSPLRILALTSVINILLNLIFVLWFSWGIVGVGFATIIAQGVSVIMIHRQICFRTGEGCIAFRETWQEGRETIFSSLNVGLAAGVQSALIQFSNIFIWAYINSFPTAVSAGMGVATKIDRFVLLPCKSLAMTTTTFVSQNIGAGQLDRARKGIWYGMSLSASVTMVLSFMLYRFAEVAVHCFSRDPDVVSAGAGMSRFVAPFYLVVVVREVLTSYLRGYNCSKMPTLITMIGMIGFRQLFLAWAMPRYGTIRVIYASFPVGWITATLLLIIYTALKVKRLWKEAEGQGRETGHKHATKEI